MENAMKVEDAKVVLQDLKDKLSAAQARHAETQAKAMELAYPANTGDESARKKLDGLNAKVAVVATEALSLEAAIVTAKRRVADPEAAAVDEPTAGRRGKHYSCLIAFRSVARSWRLGW